MKLVKLIGNLGYGSRKEVAAMFREGRITDPEGEVLYADDQVGHERIRIDGAPLDPPAGLVLMLHKPVGYTCSTKDPGRIVYDLLPPRFRLRSPLLSTVGRLDRGGCVAQDRIWAAHRTVERRRELRVLAREPFEILDARLERAAPLAVRQGCDCRRIPRHQGQPRCGRSLLGPVRVRPGAQWPCRRGHQRTTGQRGSGT